ncbi:MAG: DnaJ domain-containing protein [Nitrospinaceae bacterium]
MSWLLGAGVGFLRGGPVGALVGGAIQHFVTKKIKQKLNQGLPGIAEHGLFVACLVAALTKIAITKGTMYPKEVGVIHRFFIKNLGYDSDSLKYVDKIIGEAKRVDPDLKPIVEQYKKASRNHYNFLLLALAYQVALVMNSLSDETQERVNELAFHLGVPYEDHDRIRRKYSLEALTTPYTVLRLKPSANVDEIKKAYRKLVSEFHPDRVAHKGEAFVEEAHMKFLEILSAYQELGKIHGF